MDNLKNELKMYKDKLERIKEILREINIKIDSIDYMYVDNNYVATEIEKLIDEGLLL